MSNDFNYILMFPVKSLAAALVGVERGGANVLARNTGNKMSIYIYIYTYMGTKYKTDGELFIPLAQ